MSERPLRELISQPTWRVYFAYLEYRRAHGGAMSAQAVMDLARAEGANVRASLALTREELLSSDGQVVSLYADPTSAPAVIVPDADTGYAVAAFAQHNQVTVRLVDELGNSIGAHRINYWSAARRAQERWASVRGPSTT